MSLLDGKSMLQKLLLVPFLLAASCVPALAVSPTVVISQVYGGGGNAGATYKNDFIEIFNRGTASVDLSAWSVQYAASAGTSWQVTPLTGTIAPGQYYLIQESAGANGTVNLPTPDASGAINMSATSGKIALANNQTAFTIACPTSIDFVGFGTAANCSETTPTANLSNTTAALRAGNGCTDTDNNSTDFSVGAPNPRNSTAASSVCGSVQPLTITTTSLPASTLNVSYSATVAASGGSGTKTWTASGLPSNLVIDSATGLITGVPTTISGSPFSVTVMVNDTSGSASQTFSLAVGAAPTCTGAISIGQIQGSGDTSPLAGQTVTTSGIVTGLRSNGFFIQSPPPGDSNDNTSDGIFVFTSSAPSGAAVVGNPVCVSGAVSEFQGQTEIASPTLFALGSAQPLPAPVTLTSSNFNPSGPLDQLEKYSGMRVAIASLTVTGPTDGNLDEAHATSTSNGQFYGVITGAARPFREPGIALTDPLVPGTPANVPHWDTNPEVIQIYGPGQVGATPINVTSGAIVTNLVGVLSYFPSQYEILPDPSATPGVSGNISYTPVPDKTPGEITIASTNLERFYNTVQDPNGSGTVVALTPTAFANRLNKASLGIRNVLKLPDVVAVEEMQDLPTLQALADKINSDAVSSGGANPGYQPYLMEGNDISNINVGFLVKSTITVVDVTQYGKNTTFVSPTSGSRLLLNDRPSLILRARAARPSSNETMPFTVIVNHLRSLLDLDDPATGAQVRAKRQLQAEFLADLIQSRQAADPNEKIVVLGDFNAYQFNDGYVDVVGTVKGMPAPADQVILASNVLVSPALTALVDQAPIADRYSYTFGGSAEELDQVLLNQPALSIFSRYEVGRLNADFPEIYRNDPNRPERISDHDWPVVYLNLPPDASASATDVTGQVSIAASGLVYSRISKQYSGTVTITNTSAAALTAPLQLALSNLSAGATLANANGVGPNGSYVTALASGSLAPGASVTATIRINAPQTSSPTFSPLVFSGNF
jgi:predicted extracellular nuclease